MAKREHISLKTKLASALLMLGYVPYSDAKQMTADQVISLFHWDHNILHGIEVNNEFWNLTPKLIREHREKSKRDTAIVAKSKRLVRKEAVHAANMSTDSGGDFDRAIESLARVARYRRKIPSRPFPNKKRPFANNRGNKI